VEVFLKAVPSPSYQGISKSFTATYILQQVQNNHQGTALLLPLSNQYIQWVKNWNWHKKLAAFLSSYSI